MKLGAFGPSGAERPCIVLDDRIAPLDWIMEDHGLPLVDTNRLLAEWEILSPTIRIALPTARTLAMSDIRMGPAIPAPRNIAGVAFNYRQPGSAGTPVLPMPEQPIIFLKPTTSLTGPDDAIVKPDSTEQLDYELELAVVIGRDTYQVSRESALDHIAGYVIANDLTARDIAFGDTKRNPMFLQITRGKGAPGYCPLGPWMCTPDELPEIPSLSMQLWVNDELRQDDHCASMIVDVADLVVSVSAHVQLLPGDLILTGTPSGSASQMPEPKFIQAGDLVVGAIEGLGEIRNHFVASAPTAPATPKAS
jgi:2-keto-4-pentenoate hydratase/2-oxohepta-3-ene-1,7-dioic acid hydratase in catechol pathway